MKKLICIIGAITSFIGFMMFFTAQLTISSNSNYTWTQPYTPFEARYIMIKAVGIIFLIMGLADVIVYFASRIYTSKTEVDVKSIKVISTVCPSCGLQVNKDTKICPKCKTQINQ